MRYLVTVPHLNRTDMAWLEVQITDEAAQDIGVEKASEGLMRDCIREHGRRVTDYDWSKFAAKQLTP